MRPETRSFCSARQLEEVLFKVLLFYRETRWRRASIDENVCNIIWVLDGMLVVNQDHAIPRHWFVSRTLKADLRGFKISRAHFESFGAQFLQFICFQFLNEASLMDDSDARRQSVHFG